MLVSELNAPATPALEAHQDQIHERYAYWRVRLMYTLIVGYAAFYLVRQNFSIAVPEMMKEFGYDKTQIGWIFTAFSIIYGVSKFTTGAMADRTNARYLMTFGLIGSAVANIFIGFSNTLLAIGILHALNGFLQSAGWPSCSRTLTRWYSPKNLGTKWALCNVSHQIGSVVIIYSAARLVTHYSWRHAFIVPGVVCLFLAIFIFERLRDTPQSLGLPSLEEYEGLTTQAQQNKQEETLSFKEVFLKHLLPNKYLWYVCFANLFLYIVRIGFFNWGPTYFRETKGASLEDAGNYTIAFELAGLFGGLAAGWLSDRLFTGFRGRVSFIFMTCLSLGALVFWRSPSQSPLFNIAIMGFMGFFIYGPQVLAGVAAAEFGSKKAACAAAGLTGAFGYMGSATSGIGIGWLVQNFGWDAMLLSMVIFAFIGAGLFMMTWKISYLKKA